MMKGIVALQPAAPKPSTHHTTATTIPDPPPEVDPFQPTLVDDFLLAAFRWTLQQQSASYYNTNNCTSKGGRSDLPGFDGMVEELIDFRNLYGLEEQEKVSYRTLIALSGPVPFLYQKIFGSADYSPALLAFFAKNLLQFLVGEMELTQRAEDDSRGGGVLITRCRVLEGTNCKGVCTKMCKIPTQRFFEEEWGVPLSMTPNFETGQCQLSFGKEPIPIEDDPTIPNGCLTRCPAATTLTTTNSAGMIMVDDSKQPTKRETVLDEC